MKKHRFNINLFATALAFGGSWAFFQFAFPYHLMRREQMNLFVYDWDYIRQTYRGAGWLARFVSDFLEQFFLLPVAGPLIVSLLLVGIGAVVYRICRHFMKEGPSLGIAALFFVWSFLRETDFLYITRYTVVMLGYLSLVLLALRCGNGWRRPAAGALLLVLGFWALESPFQKYYGRAWGAPRFQYEKVIGLDVETVRENWDKIIKMSKRRDLRTEESSYCYNLAHAMKGDLGDTMLNYAQNHFHTLLFSVSTDNSLFTNSLAGEAWFHLGDMTVAEQSAITSLQASPKHTGARFLVRLARVNLISGEDAAAQKYLSLLGKTLFYRNWARRMMPGLQDEATRAELAAARSRLARTDFVHHSSEPRHVLTTLLEANPDNTLARTYLLCLDLMSYNLELFMQDYEPCMLKGRLYKEAILIWLSQQGTLGDQYFARYGIDKSTTSRMDWFFRNPDKYGNTYWAYYMDALMKEGE